MKLEFVDATDDWDGSRSNPLYGAIAESLRENPGRWAKWPESIDAKRGAQLVGHINSGRVAAMKEGFRASCRAGVLYVRFIGGAE